MIAYSAASYARGAERLTPWPRLAGWLRLIVAELSNELGVIRTGRPARVDRVATIFDRKGCVIADARLAALRGGDPGDGVVMAMRSR